jgi:hypothetical protein
MRRGIVSALSLLALGGCAVNGFERYYSPRPGSEALQTSAYVEHSVGEPKVYAYSNDPPADNLRAQEDGYQMIGSSSFYGPPATMTKTQLVAEAKKLGASLVLIHSQYKDTLSGVVPYTVPNPSQVSTVSTSGTVNSYGSGGYATGTYSGQSTITTPGGTTTYNIPYSVSRNDVVATYWVHLDLAKVRLGVDFVPLPEDLRAKLQRNTGVLAVAIMRGTPAFSANILKGDVILKIGGEDVIDMSGFDAQLTKFGGQKVDIDLLRGDTPKTITLTLRPKPQH